MKGLTKTFGSLVANDDIDLRVRRGEIHALLGENGAGKSTLVKILFGALQPDRGLIRWKGEAVSPASPAAARALGIGMVFQHFSLFEALTAAENIALVMDDKRSIEELSRQAKTISQQYGLPIHPTSLVGDLSVGERQRIEIVRCLLQNPEMIILDEPTSVLTPQEADRLFQTLNVLKDEGRAVLYISHRLEEVQRICDQATILRHGKVVARCDPRQETTGSLAAMMVGAQVSEVKKTAGQETGEELIALDGLDSPTLRPFGVSLKDVSLAVKAGEVLGVAGVAGNGQAELFELVSGELPAARNDAIRLDNTPVGRKGINERRRLGAAFIPEGRQGHAAIATMPLSQNLLLSRHSSDRKSLTSGGAVGIVRRGALKRLAKTIADTMDVRKQAADPYASSLSGGNLQKFIVGRELDRQPKILIANQPTWGVDAGAASLIRQSLIDLARSGSAVLVISQDLDEIFEISDRIAVLSAGRMSEPSQAASMSREEIGILMGASATDAGSDVVAH